MEKTLENKNAVIKSDTIIHTDINITNNKPDLFIKDKMNNKIYLIEVGVTSQDRLKTVEFEKYRKYDILANELKLMYKFEVVLIPIVLTWDGIATKYYKTYVKKMGLDNRVKAYIQDLTLKKTLESISFDNRRNSLGGFQREIAVQESLICFGVAQGIVKEEDSVKG